jgi:hypothetical protein
MIPVSPVLPEVDAPESTFSGPGYADLPHITDRDGGATSRWIFEEGELEQIVRQGYLFVRQLGATHGVQPIALSATSPIVVEGAASVEDDPILSAGEIGTT